MTKDEALRLAFAALEGADEIDCDMRDAMTAIKAAQAQPEQEPVACDCRLQADECNGGTATFHPFQVGASCSTCPCERVYASPPQRLPLTQSEVVDGFCKTPHRVQYVSVFDAGVWFAEAAHAIGDQA